MPVYNGERFIRQAINSLLSQNYNNLELIISDNASEDLTEKICKNYAKNDRRIRYYRNEKNLGSAWNFKRVLNLASGEYFMWAAHDDVWHPNFILFCIKMLETNKGAEMAFCNIVNIDSFGRVIRTYPSFEKFSGKSSLKNIINYAKDSEKMGKANLVYSIYKTSFCKKLWDTYLQGYEWGSDMCFVLAALSRSKICIDNRVLFQKRIVRDSDQENFASEMIVKNPKRHIFPLEKSFEYIKNNLRAVKNTKYYYIVLIVMIYRLPRVFWNFFLNKLNGLKYRIKK